MSENIDDEDEMENRNYFEFNGGVVNGPKKPTNLFDTAKNLSGAASTYIASEQTFSPEIKKAQGTHF